MPRQDHRWIASLGWTYRLPAGFSTLLDYTYEARSSNDPARQYQAHKTSITVMHAW